MLHFLCECKTKIRKQAQLHVETYHFVSCSVAVNIQNILRNIVQMSDIYLSGQHSFVWKKIPTLNNNNNNNTTIRIIQMSKQIVYYDFFNCVSVLA